MRRKLALILIASMLWTGWLLPVGMPVAFAHEDPELGRFHPESVTVTGGKTVFKGGDTLEIGITYSYSCTPDGTFYLVLKHESSNDQIRLPWTRSADFYVTQYYSTTVDGSSPEGVYYLHSFDESGGSCRDEYGSNFYVGTEGYKYTYFRGLLPNGIRIDHTPPQIVSVAIDSSKYAFKTGEVVPFVVTFSEPVGDPQNLQLQLNNGGTAVYKSHNNNTVRFEYTVQDGQDTNNLNPSALSGPLMDLAGNQSGSNNPISLTVPGGPWIVDTQKPAVNIDQQTTGYAREHTLVLQVPNEVPETLNIRHLWSTSGTTPSDLSLINGTGAAAGMPVPNPSNANGDYHLHVLVRDEAGNETVETFGPFQFDSTPPGVTFTPIQGRDGKPIRIEISATDALSGVKKLTYQWIGLPGEPVEVDGASVYVQTPLVEGEHRLSVTAEDYAGNAKTETSGNYVIDLTAPRIEFSKDGDATPAKKHEANVRVTGAAGESGIVHVQWTQSLTSPDADDPNWQEIHNGAFPMDWRAIETPEGLNGTWYLHVKAADDVGNTAIAVTSSGFVLDNTPPAVGFAPNGTSVFVKSAEVQLSIDGGNSIADYEIRYKISDQATTGESGDDWPVSTDGRITLSGMSGIYYIHVRVTDKAGNVKYETSQPFRLDVQPPTGSVSLPAEYTNNRLVSAALQASEESGVTPEFRYRLNEGTWSVWIGFTPTFTVTLTDEEGQQKFEVQYRDQAGNVSPVYSAQIVYDITPPTYKSHSYNPPGLTKGPVTVTLEYTDNLAPDGTVTQTFEENGTYAVTFADLAGNTNTVNIEVTNIDTVKPAVTILPNGSTVPQQSASAAVQVTDNASAQERIQVWWGWSASQTNPPGTWNPLTEGGITPMSGTDGNWYLWVRAVDEAGNETEVASQPFLLDNTPPTATITYSTTTRTAMPVTATINLSEPATVTNTPDGSPQYTFTENGTFTFEFVDVAGNRGTATAEVTWIDPSLPTAQVTMTPGTWTNQYVDVHVSVPGHPPRVLYGFTAPASAELVSGTPAAGGPEGALTEAVFRFHENGTLGFTIVDLETEVATYQEVTVDRIDRTPPTAELIYSHTTWTRDNVTVTLQAYDDKSSVIVLTDAVHTFTENGTYTFRYMDEAGNIGEKTAVVSFIDREVPRPVVTYSPSGWTRDSVIASVYFANEAGPVYILNHDGPEYTFHDNGTFTMRFADAAGNEGQVPLAVTWIDREAPTGTLQYSTRNWTHDDVIVTLNVTDNSGQAPIFIEGGSEGGGVHRFTENGAYTFIVEDAAGNRSSFTAVVDRIDRTPPEGKIFYSITGPTNTAVRAVLVANEPITVLNADGEVYDFTDNGEFTFEFADRAGNRSSATARVDWIDRTPPVLHLEYSTTEPTFRDVTVVVQANEPIYVLNNNRSRERLFRENGSFVFQVTDLAGNYAEIEAVVSNIDKTEAEITLEYSETEPTRNDVTVTVRSDRPLTFVGGQGPSVTFTNNGVKVLEATDALGRSYLIAIQVSNIDRREPEIRFLDGERIVVAQGEAVNPLADVEAYDYMDGDITDRIEADHAVDTTVPGTYEIMYRVRDTAGNEAVAVRQVMVIGPDELVAYVNREPADSGEIMIRASRVNLQWFGAEGEVKVRWAPGRLQLGEFKLREQPFPEDGLAVDTQGYYTFLIEDQERRYRLVHVYVIPVR